jgi:cell division protein FtsB
VLARFSPYAPTALFALLIFYFAVNALTGERGLLTDHRRETTLAARTLELQQLRAERGRLEMRARYLSDDNLSRDLLEERARAVLGFADPRDYVVRLKP